MVSICGLKIEDISEQLFITMKIGIVINQLELEKYKQHQYWYLDVQ